MTASAGPFTLTVRPPTTLYLPDLTKNSANGPDLVIQNILVTAEDVELHGADRPGAEPGGRRPG